MKRKLFLMLVVILSALSASAHDFKVDGITYEKNDDGKSVTVTYGDYTGDIAIPEKVTYDGATYSVTKIGIGAFMNCSELTSVTIGNSVTEIGIGAFSGCTGLTSVTIGNSVTEIGDRAFEGCRGLTSVTIPNSVTLIGQYTFEGCTGLTSLTYNAKKATLRSACFEGCQFTNLVIGDQVESIPSNLATGQAKLSTVTIGTSVTSIGNGALLFIMQKTAQAPKKQKTHGSNTVRLPVL